MKCSSCVHKHAGHTLTKGQFTREGSDTRRDKTKSNDASVGYKWAWSIKLQLLMLCDKQTNDSMFEESHVSAHFFDSHFPKLHFSPLNLQAAEGRDETHSVRVADTVSHGTGALDVSEELCDNRKHTHTHTFHSSWSCLTWTFWQWPPVVFTLLWNFPVEHDEKEKEWISLLTQLLCPFDGSACVCCIALRQIHHLRADLPPHQRIQACGGRTCDEPFWAGLGRITSQVLLLYLLQTCAVCSQCWCPRRCPFPWWSSHHQGQSSTLQTWRPAGPPSKKDTGKKISHLLWKQTRRRLISATLETCKTFTTSNDIQPMSDWEEDNVSLHPLSHISRSRNLLSTLERVPRVPCHSTALFNSPFTT